MRKNIKRLLMISMVLITAAGCTGKGITSLDKNEEVKNPVESVKREEVKEMIDREFKRIDSEEPLEYYLVFCSWDKLSESNRGFFVSMHDGNEEKGRSLYERYFLKYNLVHEVSHTVQGIYGVEKDRYFTEQGANDLAVAYWREVDPEFVEELHEMVDHVLGRMKSPVPEGIEESAYFLDNYSELGKDPAKYGYYQFKFVKNALDDKLSLHEALVKNIHSEIGDKEETSGKEEKYKVGDIPGVVNGYASYLVNYGVEVPQLYLVDQDTPNIQFVALKTEKE